MVNPFRNDLSQFILHSDWSVHNNPSSLSGLRKKAGHGTPPLSSQENLPASDASDARACFICIEGCGSTSGLENWMLASLRESFDLGGNFLHHLPITMNL
jgi:hypothetical protein